MKKIGQKLILGFIIIASLSITVVSTILTVVSSQTIMDVTVKEKNFNLMSRAKMIESGLNEYSTVLDTMLTNLSYVDDNEILDHEKARNLIKPILEKNSQYVEVYIGYPDGQATFSTGFIPPYESGWKATERGWYKQAVAANGKVIVTDPYIDVSTKKLVITIAGAYIKNGSIMCVLASDIFMDDLFSIVKETDFGKNSYAFLVSKSGKILSHPNSEYEPKGEEFAEVPSYIAGIENTGDKFEPQVAKDADGLSKYFFSNNINGVDWVICGAIAKSQVYLSIYTQIILAVSITVIILIASTIIIVIAIRKMISTPIENITKAAEAIAIGDVDINIDISKEDEIGQLANAFTKMSSGIKHETSVLERMANGDLTMNIEVRSQKDTMGFALEKMVDNLNNMFEEINIATAQVTNGSSQIASGTHILAKGSNEQTQAVEALSSSISEVAHKTKDNAEMAEHSARLGDTIKNNAEKGSAQMSQMMIAVKEIAEASKSIEKVIKVIDDIAFQTNILALNAAVEAARAGTHGKGFAVVAEEVRNLAAKSAEAARNTGTLITNSIEKSELGAKIAEDTAISLSEIVSGINESSQIASEIAASSKGQTEAIAKINRGIDQVALVIQQNSATTQESAETSEELSTQANILKELIERFKTKNAESLINRPNKPSRNKSNSSIKMIDLKDDSFGKY